MKGRKKQMPINIRDSSHLLGSGDFGGLFRKDPVDTVPLCVSDGHMTSYNVIIVLHVARIRFIDVYVHDMSRNVTDIFIVLDFKSLSELSCRLVQQ